MPGNGTGVLGPGTCGESLALSGLPRALGGDRLEGASNGSQVAGAKSLLWSFVPQIGARAISSGWFFMQVSFAGLSLGVFPGHLDGHHCKARYPRGRNAEPPARGWRPCGLRWALNVREESAVALWFLERKYSCVSAVSNAQMHSCLLLCSWHLITQGDGVRQQNSRQPARGPSAPHRAGRNWAARCWACLRRPPGPGVPWGSSDNGLQARFSAATRHLIGLRLGFGLSLCCA